MTPPLTLATRLPPPHQVASDENQYLRRRLEAIERTALKLNLPGSKGGSQALNENPEHSEVLRLRDTARALQADKLAMSQVRSLVFSITACLGSRAVGHRSTVKNTIASPLYSLKESLLHAQSLCRQLRPLLAGARLALHIHTIYTQR